MVSTTSFDMVRRLTFNVIDVPRRPSPTLGMTRHPLTSFDVSQYVSCGIPRCPSPSLVSLGIMGRLSPPSTMSPSLTHRSLTTLPIGLNLSWSRCHRQRHQASPIDHGTAECVTKSKLNVYSKPVHMNGPNISSLLLFHLSPCPAHEVGPI
jgi:hypothetical protein